MGKPKILQSIDDINGKLSDMSINIKKYGAISDANYYNPTDGKFYEDNIFTIPATNNTQAFIDAINYLATFTYDNRPKLFIPFGKYYVDAIVINNLRNIVIEGQDKYSTQLLTNTDDSFIKIGTDLTVANGYADYFSGNSQGFNLKNISIINSKYNSLAQNGSRNGIGIKDNGNGSVILDNILLRGFKYGYAAVTGGDFDNLRNIEVINCDTGIYMGLGSQQYLIEKVNFTACNESLILEGAIQGDIRDLYFVDCRTSSISIEANSTSRFGINGTYSDHDYSLTVENCWFESGAGYANNYDMQHHIVTISNISNAIPRHIKVKNCILISGTSGMGTKDSAKKYSFWEHNAGRYNELNNLIISGTRIDCQVNMKSGIAQPFIYRDCIQKDGYSTIPIWNNRQNGCIQLDSFSRKLSSTNETECAFELENNYYNPPQKIRFQHLNSGVLQVSLWNGSQYLDRLKFDIANSRILLGNTGSERYIGWSPASPTTGTYQTGSILFNSAPTVGQPKGWICTAAGTPGTWTSLGNL